MLEVLLRFPPDDPKRLLRAASSASAGAASSPTLASAADSANSTARPHAWLPLQLPRSVRPADWIAALVCATAPGGATLPSVVGHS